MYVRTSAVILFWLINGHFIWADVITHPSQLHPNSQIQTFESYSVGTATPLTFGIATLSTNFPASVKAQQYTQHPGIYEGKYVGSSFGIGENFFIDFSTPVSQFGMGILDVNYDGNVFRALDANNNVLESVVSSSTNPDFLTGPTGGSYSLFIGFKRPTNDISRIELLPISLDFMAIDTVTYYAKAIPEPSAALFCLTALGLYVATRRRRVCRG